MPWNDLREFLAAMDEKEEILHISETTDPDLEIGAVWTNLTRSKGPLASHERGSVKGFPDWQVVTNVFGNFTRVAETFELSQEELFPVIRKRAKNRIPPKVVNDGPVNENEILGDDIDLTTQIPNIRWNELDGGAYMTLSPNVMGDPEYGTNVAIYRIQLFNEKQLTIRLSPVHHGHVFARRAKARGIDEMDVAIYVGGPPSATVGTCVNVPVDVDEYDVVGALRDEALEVVDCETVDRQVPATAELVIEGKIQFNEEVVEGPFGEFCGAYTGQYKEHPVNVTRIAHRDDPIYLASAETRPVCESHLFNSLFYSISFLDTVDPFMPEIKDAYFPPESTLLECVIVLDSELKSPGVAKNALYKAMCVHPTAKNFIVVDDDIDPKRRDDLQWALTTRVQAERDIITFPDGLTTPLEPSSSEQGVTDKLGIDATMSEDFRGPVITVSDEMKQRAEDIIAGGSTN